MPVIFPPRLVATVDAPRQKTLGLRKRPDATGGKLLVSLRDKGGLLGVTRGTMRRLAAELNMKETQVVHVALRRLVGRQEIRSVSSTLL